MVEHWRPVFGFEGLYEISTLGRVRALDRVVKCRGGKLRVMKGRLLKRSTSRIYPALTLVYEAKTAKMPVRKDLHRWVAENFIPGVGVIVRHLDDNPLNCAAYNLAWGSYQDNRDDCTAKGRHARGNMFPLAKLNEDKVVEILCTHKRTGELAQKFGVSTATITAVRRRSIWRHLEVLR